MQNDFLTVKKMEVQMREMEKLRFVSMQSLFPLDKLEDAEGPDTIHTAMPTAINGGKAEKGDYFNGRDRYLWLQKTVQIPAAAEGLRPVGFFDMGHTGGGHNSGFESLLYVDGEPFQGVDTNHPEVLFDKLAGGEHTLTFMLWTGLEGGGVPREMEHRLRRAEVGLLHEATDHLYYYFKAIVKTVMLLDESSLAREDLIGMAEAALMQLDWDTDRFHATVPAALAVLEERLAKMEKSTTITATCVGHTHIDVAWLWRLKHTREKAIRSFSTVLRMMEEFDEYIFIQSQPQLYKYIKQDAPELYEKIKQRVADGRWEANGGMWLEADCNISSGEALARQFLYGIRFFQQEFGVTSNCLWLPDVFGYSWALPQIMKECNIKTFMTTKISWNQFNTIPNDLFQWRGIDGSEILTYFIETPEVGHSLDSRFATYNGQISPRSVLGSWQKFKNKELSDEVLISYGYGDGGGGPTRNQLRMRQVMDKLPGLPNVKTGKAGDFFQRLHDRVDATDRPIHTWDGELYLEYHRGTYTSQALSKQWNRRIEQQLAEAESLAILALKNNTNYTYPQDKILEAWEILMLNQFHDIIPGSSIHEVYVDSHAQYEEAAVILADVRAGAIAALSSAKADAFTLYSASSFEREDPVKLPVDKEGSFTLNGELLPAQRTEGGWLVAAPLSPFAPATVLFNEGAVATAEEVPFNIDMAAGTATTPFYELSWNEAGALTRLFDSENDREVLAKNGLGNRLEVYEDKPIDYENWDVDIFHTQKMDQPVPAEAPQLVECGPLRAVIRFTLSYRKSRFVQDMVLYSGDRRIDFETWADWHEDRRLLKSAFDTSLRTTKATYDIQYGHAERPTHSNTSWDVARFEVVAHKWADLSEADYGVSVLNDCKYGHSAKEGTLRLTMLKSGKFPDTEADMGEHRFTYALLPHAGAVAQSETIEKAAALNNPVRVFAGVETGIAPLFHCDNDAVVIDAVKKSEDGEDLIIRLHECCGTTQKAALTIGYDAELIACNILEETNGEAYASGESFQLTPFQLRTFRVKAK